MGHAFDPDRKRLCELAMLVVSYDPLLVVASILVAIMASFTGLRLASGLRAVDVDARKGHIVRAALALGGGIWSMHFIGMLAVRIPVTIEYDALYTLGSVLIAVLITGVGLAILHFGVRTRRKIGLAGLLVGLGIVSMHYVGMSAIRGNCFLTYSPEGFVISTGIAVSASTFALWLAYSRRTLFQLSLSAVMLGVTISVMHYSAMVYTRFVPVENVVVIETPALSDGYLALIVALASFLICGLFLLSAIPNQQGAARATGRAGVQPTPDMPEIFTADSLSTRAAVPATPSPPAPLPPGDGRRAASRLPYQRNNIVCFIETDKVRAVRADGHYTRLVDESAELFCPWPISRVASELNSAPFIQTHRSYIVNLHYVHAFERDKDKAFCIIGNDVDHGQHRIPVSRLNVPGVRKALGI